ncbi:unnamed protein product [Diamesa tonsa]
MNANMNNIDYINYQILLNKSKNRVTAGTVNRIILNFFASILKFIEELNKRANIHGLQHAVNTKLHPLERLVWLAIVVAACYGVYSIGQKQLDRYDANPTVISLERDYRDWNGTLPALTYCYDQRIDNVRAQYLIKRLWNIESSDEEFSYFMDYITTVVNSSIDSFINFNRFANDKRFEFLDMLTVAREVHPAISAVVTGFNPTADTPLVEIITEKGICYSLNAILSATILSTNKQLQQIADPITCSFKKTQCFMKLEVFDPTVFFVVHSPFEVVTQNSQYIHMGLTDEIENTYDIVETTASMTLRPLSIIQRKCLFYDESDANLQVYNVNVCKLTCRAKAALQLCGCRPYYYPFINGTSCSPSGLICLSINNWPNNIPCECLKTCAEVVFTQNNLRRTNWAADGGQSNVNKKSSVRFEILPQKMRFRRDVLFSFEDLIVSFGGYLLSF